MTEWEEISYKYKEEIEALWEDINHAYFEFEKGMPKSFKKGLSILEKSLAFSQENVKIISYIEPIIQSKKDSIMDIILPS